jgi:hypothetical protein
MIDEQYNIYTKNQIKMELSQKEKNEIKVLLEESKKSRSKWGWIFFIALFLLIIDAATIMYTKRFGLAIGFVFFAGTAITWLGWAQKKKRVARYEALLSKVIKEE